MIGAMWLAVQILGFLLLALLLAILALAALPVRFAMTGEIGTAARLRFTIGLLDGAIPALTVYDSAKPGKRRKEKPRKKKTDKDAKHRKVWKGKGSARMAGEVPTLLRGLLRQVELEEFRFNGRFGTGDPADTGAVFGVLSPILYGFPARRRVSIALEPDFNEACLDGRLRAALRITPITLLPPILRFAWRAFGSVR